MGSRLQRRVLTNTLLQAAAAAGPIGDGEAPRSDVAGWIGGQPNQDGTNFVPYSVITPVATGSGSGPIADSQGDIIVPYVVTSYGVSREQCEWQADSVRQAIATLAGQDVAMWSGTSDAYQRRIQQVVEQSVGAVQRVDATDPAYYGESDVVALWTSR